MMTMNLMNFIILYGWVNMKEPHPLSLTEWWGRLMFVVGDVLSLSCHQGVDPGDTEQHQQDHPQIMDRPEAECCDGQCSEGIDDCVSVLHCSRG